MEIRCEDFMKYSIQEVSNLLMEKLHEKEDDESGAILRGCDEDGRMYNLKVVLSYE